MYEEIKYDEKTGLVPVVTQDSRNGDVIMPAYMNKEALERTMQTGLATYWSRSRNGIWVKRQSESGNVQLVSEVWTDCDLDSILLKVKQVGPGACHEKNPDGRAKWSCFFRRMK